MRSESGARISCAFTAREPGTDRRTAPPPTQEENLDCLGRSWTTHHMIAETNIST
jgi:hypothetical protein